MIDNNKNLEIDNAKKENIFNKIINWHVNKWENFKEKHPNFAEFFMFFLLSNGVTVLQLLLMPLIKYLFDFTSLVHVDFTVLNIGNNYDGTPYYVFHYVAGRISDGGGGGLAYFLAVQITLGIAQVINFFAQRNITFKSNTNPWKAAVWYLIAYILITIIAAALQGLYKAPIYYLLINKWNLGKFGETSADVITMIINAAISFWVYFPILKIIFKQNKEVI